MLEENKTKKFFYLLSEDALLPTEDDERWQLFTGDNLTLLFAGEGTHIRYLWARDAVGNLDVAQPTPNHG